MRLPGGVGGGAVGRLNRIRSEEDPAGPGCARPWPPGAATPLRREGRPRTFFWCRWSPLNTQWRHPGASKAVGVLQSSHLTLVL